MAEPFKVKANEVAELAKALAETPPLDDVTLSRDGNVLIARYRTRRDDAVYVDGGPHQVVLVDGRAIA